MEPAANYRLVASAFDGAGRVAVRVYPFTVDILVQRQGDRYKIRIPHIAFAPNTAALDGVDADWLLRQMEQRAGRRFGHRTLIFFGLLLGLALASFGVIRRFTGE